jgi:hypothetical protein
MCEKGEQINGEQGEPEGGRLRGSYANGKGNARILQNGRKEKWVKDVGISIVVS